MLINNQFVFLPIPRSASTSVYVSTKTWEIPIDFGIKKTNQIFKNNLIENYDATHYHYDYLILKTAFPNKPFVGIKRDSTDRFISSVYYLLDFFYKNNFELDYDFKNFNTNDFISFFKEFYLEFNEFIIKNKSFGNIKKRVQFIDKYFYKVNKKNKNIKLDININDNNTDEISASFLCVLLSQYYYGLQYCDEIIEIKNIKILEDKIKLIKPNFNLIKINEKSKNLKLNLEKTIELEEFVYEYIDKPFLKKSII
jgi:hypothetical protein